MITTMARVTTFLIPILILGACSSISKNTLTPAWKQKYLQARDPQSTLKLDQKCLNFSQLSKQKKFPLKDLALLRAHQLCSAEVVQTLAPLTEISIEDQPWLRMPVIDAEIEEALRLNDRKSLLNAYRLKAKWSDQIKVKSELLILVQKDFSDLLTEEEKLELQTQIENLSPRLIANPTEKDYFRVANDLRSVREFTEAHRYFDLIIQNKKSSYEEIYQAYRSKRQSVRITQNKPALIQVTQDWDRWMSQVLKKFPKDKLWVERYFDLQLQLIRALWTENKLGEAVQKLDQFIKKYKNKYSMTEFYFIKARMSEEKSNFQSAYEFYSLANEPKDNTPIQKTRVLWGLGWNARKLKKMDQAEIHFNELLSISKDNFEKFKVQFWLAKTLQENNKSAEAQVQFENLTQLDLIGYYGLMAYRELARPMPAIQRQMNQPEVSEKKLNIDEASRNYLNWLLSLQEFEIAQSYIDFLQTDLQKKSLLAVDDTIFLLKKYAEAGLFLPLFAAFGKQEQSVKDEIIRHQPGLLFPQNYFQLIQSSSQKVGIPVELPLGIIRQESAFNPRARSSADAMGLMQLLPGVAQVIAQKHNHTYNQFEDLYEPSINVPLGTQLLKNLLNRFDGQYILAIASYNASQDAVRGWVKTRYKGDTLEFIEDVPYEETRGYIKLVLRNMIFYRRLSNPTQDFSFPNDLITPLSLK